MDANWLCLICNQLSDYATASYWGVVCEVDFDQIKEDFWYYWVEGRGCDDTPDCIKRKTDIVVTPPDLTEVFTCALTTSDSTPVVSCTAITTS